MFCISINARLFFERAGTLLVNLGTPRGVRSAELGHKEASRSTSRSSGGGWSGAAGFPVSWVPRKAGNSRIKFPIINGIKDNQFNNALSRLD